jgi:uncharacterized protein YlxP (DUF503 family)
MPNAIIGLCTLEFHLPGVASLKEKRSILKSLLKRLHNTFNISAAEIDHHDLWQSAGIAIVAVSNSTSHVNQIINNAVNWIETNYPDALIVKQKCEIL